MINKLTLQQKLADIKQQQEQTIANLHALQGAEQMLQLLISECTEDEEKPIDNEE